MKHFASKLLIGLNLALLSFALTTNALAQQPRIGTWELVKRTLPDGKTLTAPAVGGMSTIHADGTVHYSVFWQTPDGKSASTHSINLYKYAETELSATRLFGALDDGSGKGPVYSQPGMTKTIPIKREGSKLSYQHPFDPPYLVIDGDTMTATLDGVFVDTWERKK